MRCVPYWPRAATRLSALLLAALLAVARLACASTAATVPALQRRLRHRHYRPDSADGLRQAAQMTVQRASHTATRLQDGKVLVVGGFKADGVFLTSAELYDPATHAFVETGHTAAPHTSHYRHLVADGKVLVAGGSYGQPQQTAELYDPATGRFSPATRDAARTAGWLLRDAAGDREGAPGRGLQHARRLCRPRGHPGQRRTLQPNDEHLPPGWADDHAASRRNGDLAGGWERSSSQEATPPRA